MARKFFQPAMVPFAIKEELCLALLEEFGATPIRHRAGHDEITHGCLVGVHSDQMRNPTASLNCEKLTYKCLGCGAQGGILWLITQVRQCTWEEARAWLQGATGTGDTLMPLQRLLEFYDALYARRSAFQPISVYSEAVLKPWITEEPHPYFLQRGVEPETIKRFRLGYDAETDRVVIPHFWKDQLVGWQTRAVGRSGSKYLSTEDMPKDQTIFSFDRKARRGIVVESPMSVLRHAHRVSLEGTFGASITDRQVKVLGAHCEGLIYWLDNDEAGWKALEGTKDNPGVIQRSMKYGPVWVVDSPFAGDPGDLPTELVETLLEEALIPGVAWKRPTALACPRCMMAFHDGPCEEESANDAA